MTWSVFGLDFVLAPFDKDNNCADLVGVATNEDADSDDEKLLIDPAGLQLEDGSFWVIAGVQDLNLNAVGALRAFTGDRNDGCSTWQDLYMNVFSDRVLGKYSPTDPVLWQIGSAGRHPGAPPQAAGRSRQSQGKLDAQASMQPAPTATPSRMSLDAIRASAQARGQEALAGSEKQDHLIRRI